MNTTKSRSPKAETRGSFHQSQQDLTGDYVIADSVIQQMVGETLLDQLLDFAARFQVVADLTVNLKGEPELPESSLERIKHLADESKRRDYRRVMRAIERGVREGNGGIYKAHMTASRVVDLYFSYEPEYLMALRVYGARLRGNRIVKSQQ